MKKLVYNPVTQEMEEVELTSEEIAQREIDKNTEVLKPIPIEDQFAEKDRQILELKKNQNVTDTVVSEINTTLQELIELTLEMGN